MKTFTMIYHRDFVIDPADERNYGHKGNTRRCPESRTVEIGNRKAAAAAKSLNI